MNKLNTYTVPELTIPLRLLDFVINNVNEISTRNGAKKAIKKGEILVNNESATTATFLKQGDRVILLEQEAIAAKVFELKLDIIYEDAFLAIIYKPSGISVSGNYFKTIQNALPFNITQSIEPDRLIIPRPVHRLDNPTSGLLIIAKTSLANIKLGEMLANKTIKKTYHALVLGQLESSGTINAPIDGKPSISTFEHIQTIGTTRLGYLTLLRLSPLTGRTHQLRIHLAGIGHPIVGDKEYGVDHKNLWGKGLFLSATKISFKHPITNKPLSFEVALPNKFIKLMHK